MKKKRRGKFCSDFKQFIRFFYLKSCVRRLRERGGVAERSRSGRPSVTLRHQNMDFRLLRLRNRHLTAIQTALTTVGTCNRPVHRRIVRNPLGEAGIRHAVFMSVHLWIRHVACVVWRCTRHMPPKDFWRGSENGSVLLTNPVSLLISKIYRRRVERFACVIDRGIFRAVLLWSREAFLIVQNHRWLLYRAI